MTISKPLWVGAKTLVSDGFRSKKKLFLRHDPEWEREFFVSAPFVRENVGRQGKEAARPREKEDFERHLRDVSERRTSSFCTQQWKGKGNPLKGVISQRKGGYKN